GPPCRSIHAKSGPRLNAMPSRSTMFWTGFMPVSPLLTRPSLTTREWRLVDVRSLAGTNANAPPGTARSASGSGVSGDHPTYVPLVTQLTCAGDQLAPGSHTHPLY